MRSNCGTVQRTERLANRWRWTDWFLGRPRYVCCGFSWGRSTRVRHMFCRGCGPHIMTKTGWPLCGKCFDIDSPVGW